MQEGIKDDDEKQGKTPLFGCLSKLNKFQPPTHYSSMYTPTHPFKLQ